MQRQCEASAVTTWGCVKERGMENMSEDGGVQEHSCSRVSVTWQNFICLLAPVIWWHNSTRDNHNKADAYLIIYWVPQKPARPVLLLWLLQCYCPNKDLAATLQHSCHEDGLPAQLHQLCQPNHHLITLGGKEGERGWGARLKKRKCKWLGRRSLDSEEESWRKMQKTKKVRRTIEGAEILDEGGGRGEMQLLEQEGEGDR